MAGTTILWHHCPADSFMFCLHRINERRRGPAIPWDIALAPREDGQLDLRFARISLGTLDPEKVEFTPAIP